MGSFFFHSFPPLTQRPPLLLARKLGQGKHFATWFMHAPVKETILQLKEEISVLAISNLYCLLLNSYRPVSKARLQHYACAFRHLILALSYRESPVLRKEETCDSDLDHKRKQII